MSIEIRVNYEWTLKEIRLAIECWRTTQPTKITDWWGFILIYAVVVTYAVRQAWLAADLHERGIVILLLTFPCLMLCLLLGRGIFARTKLSDSELTGCEGSPNLGHPIRNTITDEHWFQESPTTRSDSLWSSIQSISRTGEGFVVHNHENWIRWLPIHGFESEVAIETFVEMVKSRDVKYEDCRRAG